VPELALPFWQAYWVPKATPRTIVAKLNAAAVAALADASVRWRLNELGQEIPPPEQQTPESLGAFHRTEIDKWWPIIKEIATKPD
jgi:tripartite-type tricarboxylate transporter receptor subunit TctC